MITAGVDEYLVDTFDIIDETNRSNTVVLQVAMTSDRATTAKSDIQKAPASLFLATDLLAN